MQKTEFEDLSVLPVSHRSKRNRVGAFSPHSVVAPLSFIPSTPWAVLCSRNRLKSGSSLIWSTEQNESRFRRPGSRTNGRSNKLWAGKRVSFGRPSITNMSPGLHSIRCDQGLSRKFVHIRLWRTKNPGCQEPTADLNERRRR
jgi:hypothetical protein